MPGYELFGPEEKVAISEWFDTNNGVMFAHGFDGIRKGIFKVREFERAAAEYLGARHVQAVSSGSAALLVALHALGVKPGDEIITSAFTFVATVEAIMEARATPVIAEVDNSLTLDPRDVEKRITKRTRGIIPVHMHGGSADMDSICAIARAHDLFVLEDAAWVFGGSYHNRFLGTIGDAGIFSLDFAKNITTGEGGLIVTNSADVYEKSRAYHDHGHEYNPNFPRGRDTRTSPGFNFRMTEVQGVIGMVQLKKADTINAKQREHKRMLKEGIKDCGFEFRHLHNPDGDTADALIFFLENTDRAAQFAAQLAQAGLGTKNLPDALAWHYAGTWHHLFGDVPALAGCDRLWPVTDALLRRAISIPVMVKMEQSDIDRIVETVRRLTKQLG